MPTTYDDLDFDLKLAEFKINGYLVLQDMIPGETIDRIHTAFTPLLEHVKERESKIAPKERGDVRTGLGRLQHPQRYTLTIPWIEPFADPAVFEHPVILEFLRRYWGSDDYAITCYHSNNPYPGSEYQRWHRDTRLAREIPDAGLRICPVVGVKFPLVDTSEENGSVEVLPSTQYLVDADLEDRYDELLCRGQFPSAHRLDLKKGSMWIQDVRMLHRGTPNRSERPRPELVVCYCRSWYSIGTRIEMPRTTYETLSERGKELLGGARRVDWD